jgi:proline iminopeptidase
VERRSFIQAAGLISPVAGFAARAALPEDSTRVTGSAVADELNPPGIQMAGIRMVPVVGGKYKVWTKRVGSGPVKVLLLHGGPGIGHEYLEAMESFLPSAGIEMYYYDQLGCNNSDVPDDPSLWNVQRYVEEVEEVRRGLGLEQFVLYGHSCGGIFAIEYALKYQQHLRGLVISNMAASIDSYLMHVASWQSALAPASRARLDELGVRQEYDSPDYQRILVQELYPQMICRTHPWPEPVTRAFRHLNEKIYVQMQGKSELVVTGNLKGWDSWKRLHQIKTKTLTIGARYDEMDPEDMKKMAGLLAAGTYAYLENGSHLCMWDDQAGYFRQLLAFLRTV